MHPAPRPITLPIMGSEEEFFVRRIYCVGRNYVDHIREMKEGDERDDPFFFQKPRDSIVGDGESFPYPLDTEELEYEAELVVAIGREAVNVKSERSLDLVLGYAAGVDLTRRDRQRECRERMRPWEAGKSFDHSAPCGPITSAAHMPDPNQGTLRLTVNGETRQSTDLKLMIWQVPEVLTQLSRQYRLMPGDLIYTGTPAGVGQVNLGDVIRVEIDGLAPLTVTVA